MKLILIFIKIKLIQTIPSNRLMMIKLTQMASKKKILKDRLSQPINREEDFLVLSRRVRLEKYLTLRT